ncbi:MAG: 3-hydroxyacyl-CoA dehydrogenase/enoyl-CoA hydratase family protein, partial [Firmicutes bacterium]|nr:3-hydroxyacyl-CoA dehydrogenase/enoyl-CoA hydratase family protein [Bacillota bacterium]
LLKGEAPEGVDPAFAEKLLKILAPKAPLALKMSHELMEAQKNVSTEEEMIKLELDRLYELFALEDVLAGLQSPPGRPPKYKGR